MSETLFVEMVVCVGDSFIWCSSYNASSTLSPLCCTFSIVDSSWHCVGGTGETLASGLPEPHWFVDEEAGMFDVSRKHILRFYDFTPVLL